MERKIKASKKNIKKKTDFSRKEKAITRYTRMEGTTENKQTLFSLWSLNKSSRNVVVSGGEKIVIIILLMIVSKLIILIK